jgi:hypothetical protein
MLIVKIQNIRYKKEINGNYLRKNLKTLHNGINYFSLKYIS